jgi:PAS domain S-box-containing protein
MPVEKRTFINIALVILFTGASAFLFLSFYQDAKNTAISKLKEEQTIHARQAARGIEDFFGTWTRSLNTLSGMDAIIENDAVGQRYMKLFYEANRDQITSITRLNEKGVILYNFPSISAEGTDISNQKHVGELLRDHQAVISDVFKAVEGYDSVALHVPIFRGSEFKGSIGVLINFESIAKRFLDVIKIGETGYAWVVSRDGTQLYSPIPEFIGKSVFENIKGSPALMVMVNDMLKGREGAATYTIDRIGSRNVGQVRKYAVYMPVQIGNTFWSIAVDSAEPEVLSGLTSFRNKLAIVVGAIFILGMVFSTLGAKAWFIVKEEEKRSQVEKQLRESEERYRMLFETAPVGISLIGVDGHVLNANSLQASLYGYESPRQLDGMSALLFVSEKDRERAAQNMRDLLQGKELPNRLYTAVRRDGTEFVVEVASVISRGPRQEVQGYLCLTRDITKDKESESERVQLRHELAHLSRVMTMNELSASLAHEINQPLGAILNNASAAKLLISQNNDPHEDISEILVDIIADAKRASDVIRKIRGAVKKSGALFEPLQMNALIEDVAKLFQSNISMQSVSLFLKLQPDLEQVRGDRVHLQQVLMNLTTNALEAMKGCPTRILTIRSEMSAPGTVTVSVSDSGTGIVGERKESVFEPFFTTKKDGLGLGLRICRSIIEEHGGRIWVENNSAGGATFSFSLEAWKGESA